MSIINEFELFDSKDSSRAPSPYAELEADLWPNVSKLAGAKAGQAEGAISFSDIYAATDTFKVYPWGEAPSQISIGFDPIDRLSNAAIEQTTPTVANAGAEQPASTPGGNGAAQTVAPDSGAGVDQTTAPGKEATDQVVEGKPGAATGSDQPSDSIINSISEAVGKSVKEIQPDINQRVGCALAVSHVLHQADSRIVETNNNAKLEKSLIAAGYERVSLDQAKTGDVIIGHRPDGMPGHAAIYAAQGMVFNNNSETGVMQLDSVDKFNQGMHDADGHFKKNGFSEVVVYRKRPQVLV